MARAKIQMMRDVVAELKAEGRVWRISVNLIINSGRSVMRVEPAELVNAPDGVYELRYVFDGQSETRRVRVERGDLLGERTID